MPSAPGRTTLVGRRHPERPKGVGPGGGCGGHSERGSVHHESAIRVLTGVDAVICRNLGLGLLRDLEFLGVDVYPCALDSIEEALDLFARGQLAADYMRVCRCGR
ncbi:MAG: hypothetical protein M5U22_19500 [Thermoleophilia bacterium]|nr:hypothetical protein [Thermoleophilia bacterium]